MVTLTRLTEVTWREYTTGTRFAASSMRAALSSEVLMRSETSHECIGRASGITALGPGGAPVIQFCITLICADPFSVNDVGIPGIRNIGFTVA